MTPWERLYRAYVWCGFGPNEAMGANERGHLVAVPRPRPEWDAPTGEAPAYDANWAASEGAKAA